MPERPCSQVLDVCVMLRRWPQQEPQQCGGPHHVGSQDPAQAGQDAGGASFDVGHQAGGIWRWIKQLPAQLPLCGGTAVQGSGGFQEAAVRDLG
eukprot:scaffold125259_cov18-Tisochrysis_lutea.AAC.1